MNRDFLAKHWYSSVYEQFENQTNDVEFILEILRNETDGKPQKIIEVACGGGRISIPLAESGHNVTGFDVDEFMLLRCYRKMKGLSNVTCYQANAINSDWGNDFDVVVLAGNILINIESDMDYSNSQKLFIYKSAKALRSGGHLILDYDQHIKSSASEFFNHQGEFSFFEGVDELGTSGKVVGYGGLYNPVTQICTWTNHIELITNNGEKIIVPKNGYKYIPMLSEVYQWLDDTGFIVEKAYRNYSDETLSDNETDFVRATIWAKKK